ncbi:MAG: potassium channel family protein [Pseudomonadota bacterium]
MVEGVQISLGIAWTLVTMTVTVGFIVALSESLPNLLTRNTHWPAPLRDASALLLAVLWLFLGVFLVVVIWAALFLWLGEFDDFSTAVYFSAVSVTTVGYGDITVSSDSRLLAGFAAADGFLIFGLVTAALYEALGRLKAEHDAHGRAQHDG